MSSAEGTPGLGPFLRAARNAARQALFFVDLLMPVAEARWGRRGIRAVVAGYWPAATGQIRSLIHRVQSPDGCPQDLAAAWEELKAAADDTAGTEYSAAGVGALRESLVAFLQTSRGHLGDHRVARFRRLVHLLMLGFPNGLRYLRRHLSLAVLAVLVVAVAFCVEPVWGLLRNEGGDIVLYLLLLPLVGYLHLCRFLWNLSAGRGVHPWDVGRMGFWRLRPLAATPGRSITRWPRGVRMRRSILLQQSLRTGAYLLGAAAGVALVQVLADGAPLTVPLILWLFWGMLVLANQLDLWDYLLAGPLRLTVLAAVLLCVAGLRLGFGNGAFITLFVTAALLLTAYNLVVNRPARSPFWWAVPVLLVAAAGVAYLDWKEGERSWRQSAEEGHVERLSTAEWPAPGREPVVLVAASGGGSRSAVYTALTLAALRRDFPEVSRQVQLISSVSGGSLASAAYVARQVRCGREEVPSVAEAVQGDFLLPTLTGALRPFQSRAQAIEEAWREGPVGLGQCRLGDLAQAWRGSDGDGPPFPLPMFNATTLDGHNVVITPLAKEHYIDSDQRRAARAWAEQHGWFEDRQHQSPVTWVFHRDGIYGLEDLLGTRDLLLSSAVRASANFPFGFPVVRVRVSDCFRRNLVFTPAARVEEVQLTDGGALSNSGMWSLFQLLVNRRDVLRRRGVLLIVVEASKMPSYRGVQGTVNNLLGTIRDQGGIGRNLHQRMLDVLELHYGPRLATVQLDLISRERYNVFTTWALDDESLRRLEVSFAARWCQETRRIAEVWNYLRQPPLEEAKPGETTGAPVHLIDRDRPPLD